MRFFSVALAVLILAVAAGTPNISAARAVPLVITGVPLMRQQHTLTCESSAVSMATKGQIIESQVMRALPRSANPNLGFRGSPDGQQGTKLIDYGVYAAPLSRALSRFGYASTVLTYAFDRDIKTFVNRGWPVVAWVTYALQRATPRLVTHNGVQFVLVPHEHTLTIVGYDNRTVIANDPWNGRQVRYFWSDFNRAWGYFGNMALAIEPCPTAMPVDHIATTAITGTALTWAWLHPVGAARYSVIVVRYGPKTRVEYNAIQDAPSYTLVNPSAGKTYEITVRSVSACGDLSTPVTAAVQIPIAVPTATPSATEGTVASPTSPPAAAVPSPTATVTLTATPHP